MTPKEKAKELVDKLINKSVVIVDDIKYFHPRPYDLAKQCALIAVDEILLSGVDVENYYYDKSLGYTITYREYYQDVKQEINKL